MAHVELVRPDLGADLGADGLNAIEAEWRDLERRAAGSFFQGWTWVGCLARERFPRPVLLRATAEGRTVGLALFNERRRLGTSTFWLGESGDPALDRVFVEYNGVLGEAAYAVEFGAWLRAALHSRLPGAAGPRRRRLILGGIPSAQLAAARAAGAVRVRAERPSPFVDLGALSQDGAGFAEGLSRNTRHQLRRSDRLYGATEVRRAATPAEAKAFLDRLLAWHMSRLASKQRESGLANPTATRFVQELVARGVPRGEVDVLCVSAGGSAIGYLLNLRRGSWVGQYQGGFDYAGADAHRKPGLSCHHAAIRYHRAQGAERYDFLAGGDRYKLSLADGQAMLYWAEAAPVLSLHDVVMKLRSISVS